MSEIPLKANANEISIEKTKELLDYNFDENKPRNLHQKTLSFYRLLITSICCVFSCMIVTFSFEYYIKEYDLTISEEFTKYCISNIVLLLSVLATIWLILDFILVYCVIKFKKNYNISFLSLAIIHNSGLFKAAFTLFIFSFTVKIISTFKERRIVSHENLLGDKENIVNASDERDIKEIAEDVAEKEIIEKNRVLFEKTFFEVKEQRFIFCTLMLGLLIFIILLQRIIIQYMNYKIHYGYFKERISANNRHIKCLLKLNKKLGNYVNTDLNTWAEKLFDKLLKDGKNELNNYDFICMFGKKEGTELFTLFDENLDNTVSKKEFVERYIALFNEKNFLKSSLVENDKSINKLRAILFILFLPLGIFIGLTFLGHQRTFQSIFGGLIGILLPLSFVFGSVLADVFQSILFIFTVRPFDIGDLITVEGKDYEVFEMGLLFTTLISDSRFFNFPNEILRKKPIVNLRRSKFVTESFDQHYHYEGNMDKIYTLKDEIQNFLNLNSKMYDSNFSVTNIKFDAKNTLKLSILIQLNCSYQNIKAIKERKDYFAIFLYNTLAKLKISCV